MKKNIILLQTRGICGRSGVRYADLALHPNDDWLPKISWSSSSMTMTVLIPLSTCARCSAFWQTLRFCSSTLNCSANNRNLCSVSLIVNLINIRVGGCVSGVYRNVSSQLTGNHN